MNSFDDYRSEMFQRGDLDDNTIESLLAGEPIEGLQCLVSVVDDARAAGSGLPIANAELTRFFTEGLFIEKGDLSATAASNVLGPAQQVAALPKWRKKKMFELIAGKFIALGVVAKTGAAAAALTVSTTTIAATGVLPDAIQDPIADKVEAVARIDIPGGKSEMVEAAELEAAEVVQDKDAGLGADVSEAARSGAPQEDGKAFGEAVASEAGEGRSDAGMAKAEEGKLRAEEGKAKAEAGKAKAPVAPAKPTPSTTVVKAPVTTATPVTTAPPAEAPVTTVPGPDGYGRP